MMSQVRDYVAWNLALWTWLFKSIIEICLELMDTDIHKSNEFCAQSNFWLLSPRCLSVYTQILHVQLESLWAIFAPSILDKGDLA